MSGTKSGKRKVRLAIEAAPSAAANPNAAPDWLGDRFEARPDGLFKRGDGPTPLWVSGPFTVVAETRDGEGHGWGLLLSWRDRDGALHEEAFARALFSGDCAEVRARLADGGLTLNAILPARQAFAEFLNGCNVQRRARSVPRIGWHQIGGTSAFVLPAAVFGDVAERVVLQTEAGEHSLFNQTGTLDGWREHVAMPCVGNSRLMFAVSCAFFGPLQHPAEEDGGGWNIEGQSRTGKTTALRMAASVWGGLPGAGAGGFVRQWRATGNGIEAVAASHSDALLALDELGQVDSRECGEVAYMLANGQGKTRAGRTGLARPAVRFRVNFISTGETGLAGKNAEAGRATKAGQEVRMVDIPADAGAGWGIFENLHGATNPGSFAQQLRQATTEHYGTAAPAFLRYVTKHWREDLEWPAELRADAGRLVRAWLQPFPDATGQVASVGRRFALVALAGELGTMAELTGWQPGAATEAAHACFCAWLAARGTVGAREDQQAVAQLRSFLSKHGSSRFDEWKDPAATAADQGDPDRTPPTERFRTVNRAGWKRWTPEADGKHAWRYFLTADGWTEALDGLDKALAGRVLVERGFVLPGSGGKNSKAMAAPGHKKIRLYEVLGDILGTGDGEA